MHRFPLSVALTLALMVGAAAGPAIADAGTKYEASLAGVNVAPGPGDVDGTGVAVLYLDAANGLACDGLASSGIGVVTSISVGEGAPGDPGRILLDLPIPPALDGSTDCSYGFDPVVIAAIVASPSAYYVIVFTDDFPAGAIRGQLGAHDFLDEVLVSVYVCPSQYSTPTLLAAAGGPYGRCTAVGPTEFFGTPPAGSTWTIAPLIFNPAVTIRDGDGVTRDASTGQLIGSSGCNVVTLKCFAAGFWDWSEVAAGQIRATQGLVPTDATFGFALVTRDDVAYPAVTDAVERSVTFSGTEATGVLSVTFVNLSTAALPPQSCDPHGRKDGNPGRGHDNECRDHGRHHGRPH